MMNKSISIYIFSCALAVALAGAARAQEEPPLAEPVPEVEAPAPEAPAPEAPPPQVDPGPTAPTTVIGELPPPFDPGPGAGMGLLQARFVWQDYRLPDLELDDVTGAARPFLNDRFGNRRIDYELRLSSARIELAYGFEGGAGLEVDFFGGLGFGFTELSVDAQNNSIINNGADAELTVRTEDADFDLSFGMDLWARVGDGVLIGLGSQLLYKHAEMDDQLLFNPADVVLDIVVSDISLRVGGDVTDYATLWAGVGMIVVGAELVVHEKGGGHWGSGLVTDDTFFKGLLGASLHPGDDLTANLELALMPDPQLRVQLGWSF